MAFIIDRSAISSMIICSFEPFISSNNCWINFDVMIFAGLNGIFMAVKRSKNRSILSWSGFSWTRYKKGSGWCPSGLIFLICWATVWLARSMNSSTSRWLSKRFRGITSTGFPFSSSTKRTSGVSKSMPPWANRFFVRFRPSITMASITGFRGSFNLPSAISWTSS